MRVIIMILANGEEKRIHIPDESVVTFGPAIPFNKDSRFQHISEYALRVYKDAKGKDIVAVFTGIREFRDETVRAEKLIVRESGKSVWKSDESGFSVEQSVNRSKKFVHELDLLEDKTKNRVRR